MYTFMYAYRSRLDGVSIRLNVERFRMNTYNNDLLSTYTFLNMHQTCHVTYMKHACHLPVICQLLLLHELCMLPLLPRVRACAARGKAIGLSVVCCLSSVSIKVSKSQHLSESRISKWDKECKTAKKHLVSRS